MIDQTFAPERSFQPSPSQVSWPGLAGPGHGVEAPDQRARAHVVGADVAGGAARRELLQERARDDEVAVDRRRRGDARACALRPGVGHARAQVHHAALAEVGAQAARARVEGDEPAVGRAVEDAAVGAVGGLPVGDAAMRPARARASRRARRRVERQSSRPVSPSRAITRPDGVER